MKNDPSIFRASFADWKLIKTRGLIQVVFEVPLHEADAAYQALGGMPDPARERWFGIARLNPEKMESEVVQDKQPEPRSVQANHKTPPDVSLDKSMRRAVDTSKRLAAQAGMACADPLFQKFVGFGSEEDAALYVRRRIGVASRSEIKVGTPEGDEWQKLYGEFLVWRDAPELAPPDPLRVDCQSEHA